MRMVQYKSLNYLKPSVRILILMVITHVCFCQQSSEQSKKRLLPLARGWFDKQNIDLHLDKSGIPPVKAFWSLSMYKLPEQLFIENEINRYVISSVTEGLQYNEDGSLDVYIQKENPGEDKVSNWLPAHDGKIKYSS